MRSIANLSTKLSIVGLAVLMGVSAAWANTLSEVEINALDNGYGIVLKTDEKTEMKKIVSSDNKMTLQLKDVEVSPDLNTVYNNVANIENVTVAPSGKSDIKIVFKGEGISNSKVAFGSAKNTAALKNTATAPQSIELSAPVSSYTPVYGRNTLPSVLEEDQTANPQVNEVLTKLHVSREMLLTVKKYTKKLVNKTKSGDINLVTILGVIFVFAALLLRPKKKQMQAEKQQSLSQMLARQQDVQPSPQMEREIALNRRMADNMPLTRPDGLGSVNPVNAGYGRKAYQNSQKNPYTETPVVSGGVSGIPRRRQLNPQPIQRATAPVKKQTVIKQPVAQTVPNQSFAKKTSMMNPAAAKTMQRPAVAESSDMDSMKFLESITKIYEKNGRTDLAKGLKENLRKAQMSGVTRSL